MYFNIVLGTKVVAKDRWCLGLTFSH